MQMKNVWALTVSHKTSWCFSNPLTLKSSCVTVHTHWLAWLLRCETAKPGRFRLHHRYRCQEVHLPFKEVCPASLILSALYVPLRSPGRKATGCTTSTMPSRLGIADKPLGQPVAMPSHKQSSKGLSKSVKCRPQTCSTSAINECIGVFSQTSTAKKRVWQWSDVVQVLFPCMKLFWEET